MKKIILLFGIALLISSAVNAQGYYVRVGGGFAYSTFSNRVGEYDDIENTITSRALGLGTGVPIDIAFGFKLGKYVNFEIGANHFWGFVTKLENVSNGYTSTDYYKARMFSIIPAVVVSPGLEKVNPYGRFGFLGGFMGNVTAKSEEEGTIEGITYNSDVIARLYGGICIGAQAALGVEYNVNELITLYCEAQLQALSYAPKKGEYTKYEVNGVDQLPSMDVNDKEWEYVKDVDMDEQIPDTDPDKQMMQNYSLGNYGLMIGVKFNFGK